MVKESLKQKVKYFLGLHLYRRLNWRKHISTKRKKLGLQLKKMYWLFDSKSQLSTENKLLLYKTILKLIWIYVIQLWDTASNSNLEIWQRFQNKFLKIAIDVSWYITIDALYHDLNVPYVRDEIRRLSQRYADRMKKNPNILTKALMRSINISCRLKKKFSQMTVWRCNTIRHLPIYSSRLYNIELPYVLLNVTLMAACNKFLRWEKKIYPFIKKLFIMFIFNSL
jgi:hypothetical protein